MSATKIIVIITVNIFNKYALRFTVKSQVAQLRSPVLTATGLVNENPPSSIPHRIDVP